MHAKVLMGGLVLVLVCAWGTSAYADRCLAEAEFIHSYPANPDNSKFKFKFRVSSEECKGYSCGGWVQYTIHYQTEEGKSYTKSTLTKYYISRGQRSAEVTDEIHPHFMTTKNLIIRDAAISEVSCSTP